MKIIRGFKVCGFIFAAAFSAGLGFATSASAQVEHPYLIDLNNKTVTELGLPFAFGNVYARSVNDAGQVAGYSRIAGDLIHAFITGPDGVGMTDLGTLGGDYSRASGINDAGQVVGESTTSDGQSHAFITGPNGVGMTDLGTLGGNYSRATGINESGQVVGYNYDTAGGAHAFITGPNGTGMRDLGTLGGNFSEATGINNAGQVVGVSSTAETTGYYHSFITDPDGTGMRDLGFLGGPESAVTGINDAGQVAGYSLDGAFITGPNGMGVTEIGHLSNFGTSQSTHVSGINDAGQLVGNSMDVAGRPGHSAILVKDAAFITGPNGEGMMDLNSQFNLHNRITLINAYDINNAGQVLALALIPEPEIYALFLFGLGLIGFMARGKKMGGEAFSLG